MFTGAGISVAAGFPDARSFFPLLGIGDVRPVSGFVHDVFENPASLMERLATIYSATPSPAHHAIRQLQDALGLVVWTANFDGLHEATGTRVRFVGSTNERFDPAELVPFDAVVSAGASEFGFSGFMAQYREARPDGLIVAINREPPPYVTGRDRLVRGDVQDILVAAVRRICAT